jgi:hypothetical protein
MNKNIPTFKAKKISETQVEFTCSKCKRKLHHSIEEGHRVGHCDCWPDGYYIEIEDDSPTDRIRHLEDALKEIRDIAHVSEGAEFYAMVADKALKGAK